MSGQRRLAAPVRRTKEQMNEVARKHGTEFK